MVDADVNKTMEDVIKEIFNAVDEKGAIVTVTYSQYAVTVQLFAHGVTKEAIIDLDSVRTSKEYIFEMIRAVRMLLYSIDTV